MQLSRRLCQNKTIKLKIENNSIADSIKIENETLNQKVLLLTDDLEYYKYQLDSLNNIKQKVIIKYAKLDIFNLQ